MSRPFTLLIKPAGPDCNIACRYCFYSSKTEIFGSGAHRMSDTVQEHLVKSYLGLGFEHNSFAWQGGEPTLMGLDFYRRLVSLQKQYGQTGQIVTNAFQTNGTLLDVQWCQFLAENHFLIGISLDGPEEFHDVYRKDRTGHGTYARVMQGIDNCRRYKAEFNILVLLNNINVEHPDILYEFFAAQKIQYLQFVPCVEQDPDNPAAPASYSITPHQYGRFLCRFFDRWLADGIRNRSIRIFDSILSFLMNGPQTECTFARRCNDYIVIEHNGDAFCCDFYVTNQTRLGNILETPIDQLADSPMKRDFSRKKTEIDNKCLVCRFLDVCRGGCPKDRAVLSGTHKAPSYFCEGYKLFFSHALPQLQAIAQKIQIGII